MSHPLVSQLRFTRSKWLQALDGISDTEACRRFKPMNCISWMIGHLAWHEQLYFLKLAQERIHVPELDELVATGQPPSQPPLKEMWAAWHTITSEVDQYLDTVTTEVLQSYYENEGKPAALSVGSMLHQVIYHYWYHLGESQAVRQLLGHSDLPPFAGEISSEGQYRPEELA